MVHGVQNLVYTFSLFTTALLFPWQLVEAEGQVNYLTLFNTHDGASIAGGSIVVEPYKALEVVVFGTNLNSSQISFSERGKDRGSLCDSDRSTTPVTLNTQDEQNTRAVVSLNFEVSTC